MKKGSPRQRATKELTNDNNTSPEIKISPLGDTQ